MMISITGASASHTAPAKSWETGALAALRDPRIISDLLEGVNASTHRQTELQEGSPSAWETIPTCCPAVVWQLQPSNSCTPQNV